MGNYTPLQKLFPFKGEILDQSILISFAYSDNFHFAPIN
jgi:hypothetical protein